MKGALELENAGIGRLENWEILQLGNFAIAIDQHGFAEITFMHCIFQSLFPDCFKTSPHTKPG
jgi:hypothetical protein